MVAACPFPSPQGSQVFVRQMCERLGAAGHEVHLLSYGQGETVHGGGYTHHRIRRIPGDGGMRSGPSWVKPLLDITMVGALRDLIRRHAIEVVHAHNYEACLVGLAARSSTGIPVVYHSHNMMHDELPSYFSQPLVRYGARLLGRVLDGQVPSAADHVIALCQWSAERLKRQGVAEQDLTTLPPAVDDEGAAPDRDQARAAFGLPTGHFLIGYTGNVDPYQNLPFLMAALRRCAADKGPWQEIHERPPLLVVGTHNQDAGFSAALREAGLERMTRVVEVAGYAQARKVVEASDVLVLPRRLGSGYPIKLLNYMSAAKPIIGAGCASKVLSAGRDGLLVADDDVEGFARALAAVAKDPGYAKRLGNVARSTYLERLTWDAVLPGIEEIHAQVVCRPGSGGRETGRPGSSSGVDQTTQGHAVQAGPGVA